MNLDYLRSLFNNAVDTLVAGLMPKFSCSTGRWLTIRAEAFTKDGSFPFVLRYCARSNSVDWMVLRADDTRPHVKLQRSQILYEWKAEADLTTEERNQVEAAYFIARAPGFVIADGSHDSCWRDHATEFRGNPHVNGRATQHFDGRPTVIKVYEVTIEGPPAGPGGWQDWTDKGLQDGTWTNPEPDTLTGAWACYTALFALARCNPDLDGKVLELDCSFAYYRWEPRETVLSGPARPIETSDPFAKWRTRRTFQKRKTAVLRFDDDGLVTHIGTHGLGMNRFTYTWVECYRPLSRDLVMRFLGVSKAKLLPTHPGDSKGTMGITHLFSNLWEDRG